MDRILNFAKTYKEQNLFGRYITPNQIDDWLFKINRTYKVDKIGNSVLGKPIYLINLGSGAKKILAWSQMHGNESTTTKGLVDFINFLSHNSLEAKQILSNYTLYFIPMLNPDGALLYTRENANHIDLNRDAYLQTQPESKILNSCVEKIKPDLCFNLHDQRSIFGTLEHKLPATMSFLAPAYNAERAFNETRKTSVAYINTIFNNLTRFLPNQIARFSDEFNINCIGDYLTTKNIPTILFEAGHFQDDYDRDVVREFVFLSLFYATINKYDNVIVYNEIGNYLKIPQNKPIFLDFFYKNVKIYDNGLEKIINFAAHYKEEIIKNKLEKIAYIVNNNDAILAHKIYEGNQQNFISSLNEIPIIGERANFKIGNNLFINGELIK